MKDLRRDFDWNLEQPELPQGHKKRFKARLSGQKRSFPWLRVAAVLIVAVLSGVIVHQNSTFFRADEQMVEKDDTDKEVNLENISPELATLEDYYETSIQLKIANLENSGSFQEMVKTYFNELEILEKEYKSLKQQLLSAGTQGAVIQSMIENLQLRLELLQELDQRINELKQLKNEKHQDKTI